MPKEAPPNKPLAQHIINETKKWCEKNDEGLKPGSKDTVNAVYMLNGLISAFVLFLSYLIEMRGMPFEDFVDIWKTMDMNLMDVGKRHFEEEIDEWLSTTKNP